MNPNGNAPQDEEEETVVILEETNELGQALHQSMSVQETAWSPQQAAEIRNNLLLARLHVRAACTAAGVP